MIFSRKTFNSHTYPCSRMARKNHLADALCSSLTIRGTTGFFYFVFIPAFITLSIHGHSTFLLLSVSVATRTHSLAQPADSNVTDEKDFWFNLFSLWCVLSLQQLHFKHREHELRTRPDIGRLSSGAPCQHDKKTVKVVATAGWPLSTRNSFALLSRRLLIEETRWCDVSRAIGS